MTVDNLDYVPPMNVTDLKKIYELDDAQWLEETWDLVGWALPKKSGMKSK